MNLLNISSKGLSRIDLFPNFCGDVLYDVPSNHVGTFLLYILAIHFYFNLSVNLASHFSNVAEFGPLQIPNAQMKCYEIAYTKTPHDTT